MVSTVLQKKQISFVTIKKDSDVLHELSMICKNHAKTLFFPIMNVRDVSNVESLIDYTWNDSLRKEVKEDYNNGKIPHLGIINWNKKKFRNVRCIEHFMDDIFNITTDDGTLTSNDFIPFVEYTESR